MNKEHILLSYVTDNFNKYFHIYICTPFIIHCKIDIAVVAIIEYLSI